MNHTVARLIPSEQERADLLRVFTAWTGNPSTADDLTQLTLIEAWKSDRQPNATEWRAWLFGIARNVLLRWRRSLGKDLRRRIAEPANESVLDAIAADTDIDTEVETQEIVDLLHELLEELPIETRQALLLKYINEMPQAEIANQLGLHEKAVEGRLHRGKQKLRQHLLTYKPDTAVELGIITEVNTWQPTDIWCTTCGMHKLVARWYDSGSLRMDCPSCSNGWLRDGERSHAFSATVHNGFVPDRPTFRKAMSTVHSFNDEAMAAGRDGSWSCPNCPGLVRPHVVPPDHQNGEVGAHVGYDLGYACNSCGGVLVWRFLPGSGIYTSAGKQFEKRQRRVRMLSPFDDERHGRPSIRSTWKSIDGSAEFVTWYDRETWRLIDYVATDVDES